MHPRQACAAVALTVVMGTVSAPAWADGGTYPPTGPQGNYPPSGPTVAPTVSPASEVKGEQVQQSPLPFTGAEIFAMSVGGTALVLGGAAFVVIGRRRRQGTAG